jgi:F0F1-type ATP synthase assembly protein I
MYSSLGFVLAAGAAGGFMLGWLLDGWLATGPVLSIVVAFVGFAGGLLEVLRIMNRWEKRERRDNSGSGPETG